MKRKTALFLALVLIASALLAACGNTGESANASTTAASNGGAATQATDTQAGDSTARDSIVTHIETDVASFDPNLSVALVDGTVQSQIYDTLFFLTRDQQLLPRIATEYEGSDDGLTYVFHLRDDVLFHNGDKLTAEDVVFSILRSKDSPNLMIFVEDVESAVALDDYTVEVKMKQPGAQFITYMCSIFIVNKKVVEELGDDYPNNPVGCGPYKLEKHEPAYQVTLTRFDEYYRGPARIKTAIFRVMTDLNAATIAIQAGDIDIGDIASSSYANIESDPNLKIETFESLRIDYFIPNNNAYPFDNKLVRQAVSYAIDRQLVIDTAMDGFGIPTSAMIARAVVGYSDKIQQKYYYDVEKAKALLAEAGIQTPLDIGVIKCFDSHKIDVQVMQQALAEIGLNATIEVMELNKLVEELSAGNFVFAAIGISLYADADSYSMIFNNGSTYNFAGCNNPEIEALFAQGRVENDLAKRQEIYTKIYGIADEEAIYVPGYYRTSIYAYDKDLTVDYFDARYQRIYDMHWN